MAWASGSSIWPRKFTTGSYRQLSWHMLAGAHRRPAKLLTACLPVWLPVRVLLWRAVPAARTSTAQLPHASPAAGWPDLGLLLRLQSWAGARSSIMALSPLGDQADSIFSCTWLFLWSLSPHTTSRRKGMSQARWVHAAHGHSFPAHPSQSSVLPSRPSRVHICSWERKKVNMECSMEVQLEKCSIKIEYLFLWSWSLQYPYLRL